MTVRGITVNKTWDNPREYQHSTAPDAVRVPAEMRIGQVRVAPATVLAPMAGVTDTVFRRFIRHASLFSRDQRSESGDPRDSAAIDSAITNQQSGCGLLMTEFTSADGLAQMREVKRRRYLTFFPDEHPIGAQLFGSNPATLAEAARIVEESGFDLVDLNLGCPAKRVVGSNGGSGLLRDLDRIEQIFRAVRKAVTIPFTVKFRLGWSDSEIVCLDLGKMAENEGLNAVALHARTREQGYTGQARWEWIGRLKQTVRIPVIGNGDITSPEAASAMVAETGCDGVMIGRAAPMNPWIFRQIAEDTAGGSYHVPSLGERYRMIRLYFQMLLDESAASKDLPRAERLGDPSGRMKQFATWYTHGVAGGSRLRKAVYAERTGPDVLAQVDAWFAARMAEAENGAAEPAPEPSGPLAGFPEICD
jgi:nifR3 family TIM-barrel protein